MPFQALDFVAVAERIDVLVDEVEHFIEPVGGIYRLAAKRIDEGGGHAITLGMPFVLLRDGAADAVKAGIERAVAVERAHKAAIERRDRQAIVEIRAAVGDPQFDAWDSAAKGGSPTRYSSRRG